MKTLYSKDRHGELKIQRRRRWSTPKACRKRICGARPWLPICSELSPRDLLSGPSLQLSRSISERVPEIAQLAPCQPDAALHLATLSFDVRECDGRRPVPGCRGLCAQGRSSPCPKTERMREWAHWLYAKAPLTSAGLLFGK